MQYAFLTDRKRKGKMIENTLEEIMIYFHNDYSEGCCDAVLRMLTQTNLEQTPGYSTDSYCAKAASRIRELCGREDLAVHFLVGGTQANLTVISAALRAHQAVIAADSAHIHVHETGAVEATGHKIIALPAVEGKLTARGVEEVISGHNADPDREHTAKPKMVYISQPTELGTLYTLKELEDLSGVCRQYGLLLFADGARLGYGLTADGNDVHLPDLARLCDVFYIGGTKVGALFGEAVVISNPSIAEDFRYFIKRHGGMLAKGRLLGVQFCALLEDSVYFDIARHANVLAQRLRVVLKELGYPMLVETVTNQLFPILPDRVLTELEKEFTFVRQQKMDAGHTAIRFCTSWATVPGNVDALCEKLKVLSK